VVARSLRAGTPVGGTETATGSAAASRARALPNSAETCFHFHDLRHTVTTWRPTRAVLIYQHATDERAREIAARLSDVVENESKGEGDDGGEAGALVPET
jgi:integrase